ncbi:Micrococcal nuclease [Thermobaculum terrenum ATCC BAA-798]|uniref:Micrococcal nuclease n=2 Tax=Thermobaculum TaxID=262406 RepID=D1CIQ2_THET1|nr:Micrococcal nuclease [Thermobaculum terrenum ATCC BAA-798]
MDRRFLLAGGAILLFSCLCLLVGIVIGLMLTPTSEQAKQVTSRTAVVGVATHSTPSFSPMQTSTPFKNLEGPYKVARVVDGDTIRVIINGEEETVRLIGIDTPETVDPRKPVECFGREASAAAKRMLEGKQVYLEEDPTQGKRDRYGRLLAYVWVDHTLFNLWMIRQGYAHEYTYDEPYKYRDEFRAAERYARTHDVGLWSPHTCNGDTDRPASGTSGHVAPTPAPLWPLDDHLALYGSGLVGHALRSSPNLPSPVSA